MSIYISDYFDDQTTLTAKTRVPKRLQHSILFFYHFSLGKHIKYYYVFSRKRTTAE